MTLGCSSQLFKCQTCELESYLNIDFPVCTSCQSGFFLIPYKMFQLQGQVFPDPDEINFCVPDCAEFHKGYVNDYETGTCKCKFVSQQIAAFSAENAIPGAAVSTATAKKVSGLNS